ncbi:hypothetical protein ABZ208_36725 [Streptomyces sp. NPDC006208]|uniref:hypothetical protein n=1 Tax=Streptomyces sp. NPDC006208 TaxID=3156734 RepID=UPI00339F29E4
MRTNRRSTSVLATATLLLWATPAVSQPRPQAPQRDQPPTYQANCRTVVDGSSVIAYCHNPYPDTDFVRLHVECARWWDVDADTTPVAVRPAGYAELTERCWKEIGAVWISHQPRPDGAGT